MWLELSGKKVTDEAVDVCILPLASLKFVSLSDVAISNEALVRLASLQGLQHLHCTRDARHGKIFEAMNEATRLEVTDMPLDATCEFLADYHDVPFRFDNPALEAAGIRRDVPLTYTTPPQITLGEALDNLLAPAGLGWYLADGAIVVSSRKSALAKRAHVEALRQALPNLRSLQVD